MLSPLLREKEKMLVSKLKSLSSVAIAFSGGIDSSLLLWLSHKYLGRKHTLALTIDAPSQARRELAASKAFCKQYGIEQEFLQLDNLAVIQRQGNNEQRCYFCKRYLFSSIKQFAQQKGFVFVAEGTNKDDEGDFRPGQKALVELSILSPLKQVGMTKDEIRSLARYYGLANWNKAAQACLVTRFPYHVEITPKALQQIEAAEDFIISLGFSLCRVRHLGEKIALIEVLPPELAKIQYLSTKINRFLRELGYLKIIIAKDGYQKGRMDRLSLAPFS